MIILDTPNEDELICYCCYQNRKDTESKILFYLPDDPLNYPATCERCGGTMIEPGKFVSVDESNPNDLKETGSLPIPEAQEKDDQV
jgi:hypothetical protein